MGYVWGMTVEAIKEAIAGLPDKERHSLAAWLNELDYDEWDKEMVKDFSPGGRGYHLVDRVKRDIAQGKTRLMDEGFAARRKPQS
ncbi:MAG: hypothetical protein ABSG03_14470 [Bryobacteraceae bacterium]|jgi:hypothetical protein